MESPPSPVGFIHPFLLRSRLDRRLGRTAVQVWDLLSFRPARSAQFSAVVDKRGLHELEAVDPPYILRPSRPCVVSRGVWAVDGSHTDDGPEPQDRSWSIWARD